MLVRKWRYRPQLFNWNLYTSQTNYIEDLFKPVTTPPDMSIIYLKEVKIRDTCYQPFHFIVRDFLQFTTWNVTYVIIEHMIRGVYLQWIIFITYSQSRMLPLNNCVNFFCLLMNQLFDLPFSFTFIIQPGVKYKHHLNISAIR